MIWPAGPARAAYERALARLEDRIRASGPALSTRVLAWMDALAPGDGPRWAAFTHLRSFPMLALPWWAEEGLAGAADPALQEDQAFSSMAAYFYIRLMDQVMDEPNAPERPLLPALGVFHLAFLEPYRTCFAGDHPFHDDLAALWTRSAAVTLHDAVLDDIDEGAFLAAGGRKQCAARIPVQAVLHRHGRLDRAPDWERFFERYGRWHQMENDVFDWKEDLERGRTTFFLSEARREAARGRAASATAWILRDGLRWAFERQESWWRDAVAAAEALACPPVQTYLSARKAESDGRRDRLLAAAQRFNQMATLFAPGADAT